MLGCQCTPGFSAVLLGWSSQGLS
uniref:Uncharacterized protein n=1 Tax=Anguilla anguilla TaxID=7936 RepID=A0A0E9QWA8_ANGAN